MFLASILLLAILAIGAASASEDISDEVAAVEPTDEVAVIEPTDDVVTETVDEELIEAVEEQPIEEAASDPVEEIEASDDTEISDDLGDASYYAGLFQITYHDYIKVDKNDINNTNLIDMYYGGFASGIYNFYVNDVPVYSRSISYEQWNQMGDNTWHIPSVLLGIDDYGSYNIKVTFEDSYNTGISYEDYLAEHTVRIINPEEFMIYPETFNSDIRYIDHYFVMRLNSHSQRNGILSIYIDDELRKSIEVLNGKLVNSDDLVPNMYFTPYKLGLEGGIYNYSVRFTENGYFEETIQEGQLYVLPLSVNVPEVVSVGEEFVVSVKIPDVFEGTFDVYDSPSNELLGAVDFVNGVGTMELSFAEEGEKKIILGFSSPEIRASTIRTITVYKNAEGINVSVSPLEIEFGEKVFVKLNAKSAGELLIFIDGIEIESTHVSSISYAIANLAVGSHSIKVVFSIDGSGETPDIYSNTFKVNVKEKAQPSPIPTVPAKIVANDYSAYYNKGTYSVTVYGTDGKVAKGASVVFKINGKKVATVKTDAKGVAKVKISNRYVPKTYKISATALGKTVTKKLTVKQVLKLKKVAVKKSAKKLVITATLKEGKKAIKGKKITFSFNGKKYVAKTNKKGIAKITIKANVLKKLKVGKKITYKATYLKDTVKRTVRVKK